MATEPTPEQGKLAQGTEKTLRLVRPSIVVLCGPAACGKSTFAEHQFRATQIISSDWARGRVCDDERDQRYQAQAFALVHFLIEQRLSLNRLCVVDSTALTLQARKDLLDLARKYQVPCIVLLLDIPLEKCLERDQARERTVGRPVIERQYQLFRQAKASIRQEGFEQVIDLLDEDLNKVRIEIIFRPVARPATAPARPAPGPWRRPVSRGAGLGPGEPRAQAPARPAPYQPRTRPPIPRADLESAGIVRGEPAYPVTSRQAERLGTGPESAERAAAPPADARAPIPSPPQPSPSPPVGTAPAATPKPDVSGPAPEPSAPPASQGVGEPSVPPETSSGGPPEQEKT